MIMSSKMPICTIKVQISTSTAVREKVTRLEDLKNNAPVLTQASMEPISTALRNLGKVQMQISWKTAITTVRAKNRASITWEQTISS